MARLTLPLPQGFCAQSSFGQTVKAAADIGWTFSN
jgi:hypothetical protein